MNRCPVSAYDWGILTNFGPDMAITVITVESRRQLKAFADFGPSLYKGNKCYVPLLRSDVMDSFSPKRNAAYEFCRSRLFLAMKDGQIAGRVAALINERANAVWQRNVVRFGWIEFIDDREVSASLLDAVKRWGLENGMVEMEGPLGFTDFDPEGMLTSGYDCIGTMSSIYNHPYYPEHMLAYGLEKGAGWVEWQIPVTRLPEKMLRLSGIVLERYGLHKAVFGRKSAEAERYACSLFHLVNEAFAPLYGYSAFSDRQIQDFVRRYLPLIDKRLVCIILDSNDQPVAAGMALPSLARALQKAGGRLFPFGWWHLIKTLKIKADDALELMFLAVKPEYQGKGLNAVIFDHIFPTVEKLGIKYAETNPELETNQKMQSHWQYFEGARQHKSRCTFKTVIAK